MIDINVNDYGNVIVVNIEGLLTLESTDVLNDVWNEYIPKKPKTIGLNCKKIKSIDSSALGFLVNMLNEAMKMGIEIIFYDLSDEVKRVFKTAKLINFFKVMEKWKFEMQHLP